MNFEQIQFKSDGKFTVKNQIEIKGAPVIIEIEYDRQGQILGMFTKTVSGEILDYTSGDIKKLAERRRELELLGLRIENPDIINRLDLETKI